MVSYMDFLNRVAVPESGGRLDARNPASGAYGRYQIMPATARGLAAQGHNFDLGTAEGQAAAASELTRQNAALLRSRLRREPTEEELYFAHALGGPAAAHVLSDPSRPLGTALREFYGGTRQGERFADRIYEQNPQLQRVWDQPGSVAVAEGGARLGGTRSRPAAPIRDTSIDDIRLTAGAPGDHVITMSQTAQAPNRPPPVSTPVVQGPPPVEMGHAPTPAQSAAYGLPPWMTGPHPAPGEATVTAPTATAPPAGGMPPGSDMPGRMYPPLGPLVEAYRPWHDLIRRYITDPLHRAVTGDQSSLPPTAPAEPYVTGPTAPPTPRPATAAAPPPPPGPTAPTIPGQPPPAAAPPVIDYASVLEAIRGMAPQRPREVRGLDDPSLRLDAFLGGLRGGAGGVRPGEGVGSVLGRFAGGWGEAAGAGRAADRAALERYEQARGEAQGRAAQLGLTMAGQQQQGGIAAREAAQRDYQLALQRAGIEQQRYGVDVAAQTARDTRRGASPARPFQEALIGSVLAPYRQQAVQALMQAHNARNLQELTTMLGTHFNDAVRDQAMMIARSTPEGNRALQTIIPYMAATPGVAAQ